MSQVIAFVIGAFTVLVGQMAAHRYTLKRERRSQFAAVLDRTLRSFVEADRAVCGLIVTVDADRGQDAVLAAGDAVTVQEVEMRAALLSLAIRLEPEHAVISAFTDTQAAFTATYTALEPALLEHFERDKQRRRAAIDGAVKEAREKYRAFQAAFVAAVEESRTTLGLIHDY